MAKASRIRIRLKSYDHRIIDEAAEKIVKAVVTAGATVVGPIPLPNKKKTFVVTTSPHTDKDAREHYQMIVHQRLIDILNASLRTIDRLQHLDLPAGVQIEVKM